jgi:hypothetical protein
MHIKGLLREPKKFGGKEIEAIFIGQRSLIPEVNNRASTDKPKCVGSITMRGEFRQFIGDLPFDSLPMIASRLENKQLRYIQLHGPSPYRGTALTTEIRFFKDYDPEDY